MVIAFNTADLFLQQNGASGGFRIKVDNAEVAVGYVGGSNYPAGMSTPLTLMATSTLAPGLHTVWTEWWASNATHTLTIGGGLARMMVERFGR